MRAWLLVAVLLMASYGLSGCTYVDPCSPRTHVDQQPLFVPKSAGASASEGGSRLQLTILDENEDGAPLQGVGVAVWRISQRSEEVSCGDGETRTDTYRTVGLVLGARTDANGVVDLRLRDEGTMGLVVGDVAGYLGRALGDPHALGESARVGLLRSEKAFPIDEAFTFDPPAHLGLASGIIGAPEPHVHALRAHEDAQTNGRYWMHLEALRANLVWENQPTSSADLGLELQLAPDGAILAESPEPFLIASPSQGGRQVDVELEDDMVAFVADRGGSDMDMEAHVEVRDHAWHLGGIPYQLEATAFFVADETYRDAPILS